VPQLQVEIRSRENRGNAMEDNLRRSAFVSLLLALLTFLPATAARTEDD